jgi:flagellin-like protein
MGKMKANRKFIKGEEAVSAVIGVILMVAITVAIAATVYVYVSGMIGTAPQTTPNIQLTKDNTDGQLLVASADPGNLKWNDFEMSYDATVTWITLTYSGGGSLDVLGATYTALSTLADTAYVTAGNVFNITGTGTLTLRHVPTNTLVGTYTFS